MPDNLLPAVVKTDYGTEIQNFERGLLQRLMDFGLPSDSILVPVTERAIVFNNAPAVLERFTLGLQTERIPEELIADDTGIGAEGACHGSLLD